MLDGDHCKGSLRYYLSCDSIISIFFPFLGTTFAEYKTKFLIHKKDKKLAKSLVLFHLR